MKYSQLISFNPITTVIQLTDADNIAEEEKLVRSYVMSDDMEKRIADIMLGQLQFDEFNDNKGILLVGNYGTGKSHLMSLISAVAHDAKYLSLVQNKRFAADAKIIAGKFEVLRIEIGASTMSLRDIILSKIKEDFKARGLDFSYPAQNEIVNNKGILTNMMALFAGKYGEDKGYLVVIDEMLDYLGGRKEQEVKADIKEVIDKSGKLEDILSHSFPKKLYKPLAIKIIYALSVHRLTTGDISIRSGLTAENLRDDLCLYLNGMPDQSSETLQGIVYVVLKDIMTTVSGQFVEHNDDNGQYYLDLKKDIDYDEKITQRAAMLEDDQLNRYFFTVVYTCLEWDAKEKVTNFNIYEHTLNWGSHSIFRSGYLFLGTPENRPTAQPPEDYYIYFLPPYGETDYQDEKKPDEVFFAFRHNEDFKSNLKLYAAALMMKELAEEKNKPTYASKAEGYRKKLTKYFSDNKSTCFDVIYRGEKHTLLEVLKGQYKILLP